MKKIVVVLFLCILSFACGPVQEEVEATSSLGNPDPMSVACATNYIRKYPHFCLANVLPTSGSTLVADNTCRSVDLTTLNPSAPSSTTAVLINATMALRSNNTVALRAAVIEFYNSTTCNASNLFVSNIYRTYENPASGVGTFLSQNVYQYIVPVLDNGKIYYIANDAGGTASTPAFQFYIAGYYD